MSRNKIDMRAEKELAKFLDANFYSSKPISVQRVYDDYMQKRGVDVIVSVNNKQYFIDEKAALYYINKNLPTFAFELGYVKNEEDRVGWFINDELITDKYFLLWPNATTSDLKRIVSEDFTTIHGMMIDKSALKRYLASIGLNDQYLIKRYRQLRNNGSIGKHSTGQPGIYFYVSNPHKYSESPINLVISRSNLEKLASSVYDIEVDSATRLG